MENRAQGCVGAEVRLSGLRAACRCGAGAVRRAGGVSDVRQADAGAGSEERAGEHRAETVAAGVAEAVMKWRRRRGSGCGFALVVLAGAFFWAWLGAYPFLARQAPVASEVLVVEGWLVDDLLAARAFLLVACLGLDLGYVAGIGLTSAAITALLNLLNRRLIIWPVPPSSRGRPLPRRAFAPLSPRDLLSMRPSLRISSYHRAARRVCRPGSFALQPLPSPGI